MGQRARVGQDRVSGNVMKKAKGYCKLRGDKDSSFAAKRLQQANANMKTADQCFLKGII